MTWLFLLTVLWLVVCAVQDLRRRQVPNWLTVPPFVAAGAWAVWHGGETLLRFGLVSLVALVLFWKGGMGGADGKILGVLSVVWPLALVLALGVNIVVGIWFWARRRAEYPAVPAFAAGALLAISFQLLQGR